jgi:signal transduction histidine kinase
VDLSKLMAALGSLVLERDAEGRFIPRSPCPDWCPLLGFRAPLAGEAFAVDEVFPFLDSFLPDAERVWSATEPGPARSDFWTQIGAAGDEVHLEASALRADSRDLLVIGRNEELFGQTELVLQRARELRLAHDALGQEVRLKELLVHSIVHDLVSPLHSILGALALLEELPLGAEAAELTELAVHAAQREKSLVADILDVFSSEHRPFLATPGAEAAPDLACAIREIVRQAQPAAHVRGLQLYALAGPEPVRVVAEQTRLERVLANLVENALRHGPVGKAVTVSLESEARTVRVNVDDEGPGVPSEVLPHLFELFAGGTKGVRGTGMGLYFCRVTVERWDGGIGYERRAEGGSRFWIRLLSADDRYSGEHGSAMPNSS